MAVYKRDIADINLETGNIHRTFLNHSIGLKDQKADHFGVRVFRDGEPVNLSGVSVQGVFMPPQGSPIAITSGNIVSGNVAEVVLPQACYNYDGQFCLAIKLVDATNSVTGTVRIVDGMVDNTHASGTVAPTSAVPTYQEVLAVYEQAIAAISTVNAMAGKMAVDITAGAEATSNNSFKDLGNRWMTFRRGYYSTPSAGSTSSYTDDVNYVYALVACAPGDVLHAHGYGDGTSKSAWAFLDSSLKILDRGGSGNYEGATDPAPTSTAFALVNVKLASLGSGYYGWIGAEAIKDQIATLKDAVSEDGNIIYSRDLKSAIKATNNSVENDVEIITGNRPLVFVKGYYKLYADNTQVDLSAPETSNSTAQNMVTTLCPCEKGDVFYIRAKGGLSTAAAYGVYDSQGRGIARSAANTLYEDVITISQDNAAYFAVNNQITSNPNNYYAIKGTPLKKEVDDLYAYADETREIVNSKIREYTLIDGYNASNNTAVNIQRSPWMIKFKKNDVNITKLKLKISTAGTLSVGVYDSDVEDGDTYDQTKYTNIETFTINETGVQELHLTDFIESEIGKCLAIGQPTDTAVFVYGSHGQKGFYYNDSGVMTKYNQSLGITVSGYYTDLKSVFAGKKISIYGDSISTFKNWIPEGNATYYTGNNAGVSTVNDTWWKKTIDALGLNLLVNNSWSGRAVSSCRDGESAHETDAGYKETNVLQLKDGDVLPEIIIIKLGINDFNHGAYLGTYDGSAVLPTDPTLFTDAYAIMLNLIMTNFPLADVYCCTLMQCEMNNSVTGFPEINTQGESLIQWNEAIRKLAHAFGAKVLDHDVCGLTYYNLSTYMGDYSSSTHKGLHPNASGHSLIANQTIHDMDNAVRERY